jgi:hypothetical protein
MDTHPMGCPEINDTTSSRTFLGATFADECIGDTRTFVLFADSPARIASRRGRWLDAYAHALDSAAGRHAPHSDVRTPYLEEGALLARRMSGCVEVGCGVCAGSGAREGRGGRLNVLDCVGSMVVGILG